MKFLRFNLPISGRVPPDSFYRIDTPAIPFEALREALLNALVHRDYTIQCSSVHVAVYDDRVEISSPGRLPQGIKLADLKKRHDSIRRNPLIASILYICGMIEQWGRGTLKMIELCKKAGNNLPQFEESTGSFLVTFPLKEPLSRITISRTSSEQLTDRQKEIVDILKHGPLSRELIMEKMKNPPTSRTVQIELSKLKKLGFVAPVHKARGRSVMWILKAK